MTLAEQFDAKRKPDYADAHEFIDLILTTDPKAECILVDGRVKILFSDGSVDYLAQSK